MKNLKEKTPDISSFQCPSSPSSYFLSFEGIEGSGKSTQLKNLKSYLEGLEYRVIILREPGGTAFGEKLRGAILASEEALHPIAEAYLFASSRAQLLNQVILKELSIKKTVVICDRYIDSSIAYQGHARGLGTETILKIHELPPLNSLPHQTYYLDIDLQTSFERQKARGNEKDYFESESKKFYQKLIQGFQEASRIFPDRIKVINGHLEEERVSADIQKYVNKLLGISH